MKLKIIAAVAVVFTLFFAGCESKPQKAQVIEEKSNEGINKVEKSKNYTLKTTEGKTITFEASNGVLLSQDLNGKMVLINFWATWCPPCVKEMPMFAKLQEKYKDDFVIIGVLFEEDKDKEELAAFMKKMKINFPITVGESNFELAKNFGDIKKIPESFLYSKEGFFLEKFLGEVDEAKLENYIKQSME